jgi:phosphopantetheinyl transferase (holo-ACP synthase)
VTATSGNVLVRWRAADVTGATAVAGHRRLDERERARAAAISHPGARQRFGVGRALLREVVAEHRPDLATHHLSIEVARSGRPYLAGVDGVEVSLAHTHGLAVAAIADGAPVGIDVEPATRAAPSPSERWLTPRELRHATAPQPDHGTAGSLLHRWVAKEAALKACDELGPAGRGGIEVRVGMEARDAPALRLDPPPAAVETARGDATVAVAADARSDAPSAVTVPVVWFDLAGFLVAVAARTTGPEGR